TGITCRAWTEGRDAIALGAAIRAYQLWGDQGLHGRDVQVNAGQLERVADDAKGKGMTPANDRSSPRDSSGGALISKLDENGASSRNAELDGTAAQYAIVPTTGSPHPHISDARSESETSPSANGQQETQAAPASEDAMPLMAKVWLIVSFLFVALILFAVLG